MFRLVAEIYFSGIGILYWEKLLRHTPCRILRVSVNGASMIFSLASWVNHFPIGCRYPFIRYRLPSLGKTTATCLLPHPENERQWIVNDFQL